MKNYEFCRLTDEYHEEKLAKYRERYKNDEYELQAIEFLAETKTDLDITYLRTGKYFHGDTEVRRIYQFTLRNERGSYTAEFGDSIHNTMEWAKNSSIKRAKYQPNAYSILSCMMLDYSENIQDFCSEFGYEHLDPDNHDGNYINEATLKIYRAVQAQDKGMRELFDEEQLDKLQEIS